MPTDLERLLVQIEASYNKYEKQTGRLIRTINGQTRTIERKWEKSTSAVERRVAKMGQNVTTSLVAITAAIGTREVVQYSDAWTQAGNKIRSAEVVFGKSLGSLEEIKDISNSTRQELSATVDLYTRLARAGGKLGKTQSDIARATEIANQAFKGGGGTSGEQRSAILQLGQALQSGNLAGDELRALRENAPLIAEAIADAMDVSVGELKRLGAEGAITADIVFDAILNGSQKIEAQFAATNATVSDSFTILRNEFTAYVGNLNEGAGASKILNGFVVLVAENIELLGNAAIVAASVIGGKLAGRAMISFVTGLKAADLSSKLLTTQLGRVALQGHITTRAMTLLNASLAGLGGPIGASVIGIGLAVAALAREAQQARERSEELKTSYEAAVITFEGSVQKIDKARDAIKAFREETEKIPEKADQAAVSTETLADQLERIGRIKARGNAEEFIRGLHGVTVTAQQRIEDLNNQIEKLRSRQTDRRLA